MVLTLTGYGGSSGDDISTYIYSSELDIKNLGSSDADDQCPLRAIHAVIDGLMKTDKKRKYYVWYCEKVKKFQKMD